MQSTVSAMIIRIGICAQISCRAFQLGVGAVRSAWIGQHATVLHPKAEDRNHEPEDQNSVNNVVTGSHDGAEIT